MKYERHSRDANAGLARFDKISIILFALVAAGIAFLFEGQPEFIANSHAMSQPPSQERLIQKDIAPRYSANTSPAYCPVGQGRAGDGSNKSFCDKLWRNESLLGVIGDTEILSWTRKAVEKGVSALGPAIQLLAGNCLSFLK